MAATKKVNEGLKSGVKSSEFYMALSAVILGIVISTGVVDPDGAGTWDKVVGVVCSLLAALGYTVSRSNVKAAAEENK
jgi:hypothetical protein